MPRDGAKLSEVVFHKSISVVIPPLGNGRISIEKRGDAALASLQITDEGTPRCVARAGPSSAGPAHWAKKTTRRPGLDASDIPVGETSWSRFLPVGETSRSRCKPP